MNVISRRTLKAFWDREPKARAPLEAWYKIASRAERRSHHDVEQAWSSVDIVGDSRIIFDIGGNKFRVIAHTSYAYKTMNIKFVGTHKEYDEIVSAEDVR